MIFLNKLRLIGSITVAVAACLFAANTWAAKTVTGQAELFINDKKVDWPTAYANFDSYMKIDKGEKSCQRAAAFPKKPDFVFYSDVGSGGCANNFTKIVFHPKANYPTVTIKIKPEDGKELEPSGGYASCRVKMKFTEKDGKMTEKEITSSGDCSVAIN